MRYDDDAIFKGWHVDLSGKAEAIIDSFNIIGKLPDSLENLIIKHTDDETHQKWR